MNIEISRLLKIIGAKEFELDVLREKINQLTAEKETAKQEAKDEADE